MTVNGTTQARRLRPQQRHARPPRQRPVVGGHLPAQRAELRLTSPAPHRASAPTAWPTITGTPTIFGGLFIEGAGRLLGQQRRERQLPACDPQIVYRSESGSPVTAYGTAGIIQNTWRELLTQRAKARTAAADNGLVFKRKQTPAAVVGLELDPELRRRRRGPRQRHDLRRARRRRSAAPRRAARRRGRRPRRPRRRRSATLFADNELPDPRPPRHRQPAHRRPLARPPARARPRRARVRRPRRCARTTSRCRWTRPSSTSSRSARSRPRRARACASSSPRSAARWSSASHAACDAAGSQRRGRRPLRLRDDPRGARGHDAGGTLFVNAAGLINVAVANESGCLFTRAAPGGLEAMATAPGRAPRADARARAPVDAARRAPGGRSPRSRATPSSSPPTRARARRGRAPARRHGPQLAELLPDAAVRRARRPRRSSSGPRVAIPGFVAAARRSRSTCRSSRCVLLAADGEADASPPHRGGRPGRRRARLAAAARRHATRSRSMTAVTTSYGAALAAMFGAILGSFLNVVAYRLPKGESLSAPRSRCPGCETPIKPLRQRPRPVVAAVARPLPRCGTLDLLRATRSSS